MATLERHNFTLLRPQRSQPVVEEAGG